MMRENRKMLMIWVFSLALGLTIYGQETLNDANLLFNDAIQIINDDPQSALQKFKRCIEICDIIGAEADSTKLTAQKQLPICYYKIGFNQVKADQIQEAIDNFIKAKDLAIKVNDDDIKARCDDYIPKLYYQLGGTSYKNKDYNKALENYNKAIEFNPSYAKAYYAKALSLDKLNKTDEMIAAIDKAIETALATNDNDTYDKASKKGCNEFIQKGFDIRKAGNNNKAIEYFLKATEYDNKSAEAYYQLAATYNKIEAWAKAIEAANKAIANEENDDLKRAKIYYELGTAYFKINNIDMACTSYKKAMFGQYMESAKYQVEKVVKCQ